MPVAVQAVPFVLVLGVAAVVSALVLGPWGGAPAIVLIALVLFFFRDPERRSPPGEDRVVSPADGRVTAVEGGPGGWTISIFLSLLDCHINRSPVRGVVLESRYSRGRFRPAYDRRAGPENERNHLKIRSPLGEYGVTQIAGILARRIVCTKRPGDEVERGERIGLIQFGSRTDLHLPPGVDPLVAVGDRVRGGLTVVATAAARARLEPAPSTEVAGGVS